MKPDIYNDVIKKLREVKLSPDSPVNLTETILHKVNNFSSAKSIYVVFNATRQQWMIINSIRNIAAIAAVFLFGFFIFQQWEINNKLNKLEKNITISSYYFSENNSGTANFQLTSEFFKDNFFKGDSVNKQVLQINRKSLNYILKRINELEEENISIREKLKKYSPDSLKTTFK